MNSVLSRPSQVNQFQPDLFSNFQNIINKSSSSLDSSHHTNKSETDYWINYYTEQKNKEKEVLKTQKIIKTIQSEKKILPGSANARRQLVFSRPFKSKISCKQFQKKKDHEDDEGLKNQESTPQKDNEEQPIVFMDDSNLQKQDENSQSYKDLNQENQEQLIISPPMSATFLSSMKHKQVQADQTKKRVISQQLYTQMQQNSTLLQHTNQSQQPSISSLQVSPIQSVTSLTYKNIHSASKLKTSEGIEVKSSGIIPTASNISSLQYTQQQNSMLQSFKSVGDINTRKNSIFKDESNQNLSSVSKNFLEMQCIHINKLKGIGEKQQIEMQKNLFSNNQILFATLPNNSSYLTQQLHQQPIPPATVNGSSTKQSQVFNNQQSLGGQSIQSKMLEKSILNFQKQKQMSQLKYNAFLSQGNNKISIAQTIEQNAKPQEGSAPIKLRTDSVMSSNRGGCQTPVNYNQEQTETNERNSYTYQDSFLELNRDSSHKLFLLEGYNQQSLIQKQSLQSFNKSEIIQNQYQQQQQIPQLKYPNSPQQQPQSLLKQNSTNQGKPLSSPNFFQELNKQRILSGSQTSLGQNTSNNKIIFFNQNKPSAEPGKKRIASANQYNRKLYSNYTKYQESNPLKSQVIKTITDEPINFSTNNNNLILTIINNNNNNNFEHTKNINDMNEIHKTITHPKVNIKGFNVLEGIQALNFKQQQGSVTATAAAATTITPLTTNATSTTTATTSTTTTPSLSLNNKQFKIPVSSTPKTQKSFQVLYKICNKNILDAGLKEMKPSFYSINMN